MFSNEEIDRYLTKVRFFFLQGTWITSAGDELPSDTREPNKGNSQVK